MSTKSISKKKSAASSLGAKKKSLPAEAKKTSSRKKPTVESRMIYIQDEDAKGVIKSEYALTNKTFSSIFKLKNLPDQSKGECFTVRLKSSSGFARDTLCNITGMNELKAGVSAAGQGFVFRLGGRHKDQDASWRREYANYEVGPNMKISFRTSTGAPSQPTKSDWNLRVEIFHNKNS